MENSQTSEDIVKQKIWRLFGKKIHSKWYQFEVRKGPFLRSRNDRILCFTRRQNIAKTLDVIETMISRFSGVFLRWSSGRTEIAQTLCLCMFPRLGDDRKLSRHRSELTPVHVLRRRPARHARNCRSKSGSKLTPVHGCAFEILFRLHPPL